MRSISSFDSMAIVNPPEHNDSPSLTVVTPCVDISKLMDRVMRGLTQSLPIGHDDFELTTDEEYRDAPMEDSNYIELSDDSLVDLSLVQSKVQAMRELSKSKSRRTMASGAKQREGLDPSKVSEAEKGQNQPDSGIQSKD